MESMEDTIHSEVESGYLPQDQFFLDQGESAPEPVMKMPHTKFYCLVGSKLIVLRFYMRVSMVFCYFFFRFFFSTRSASENTRAKQLHSDLFSISHQMAERMRALFVC